MIQRDLRKLQRGDVAIVAGLDRTDPSAKRLADLGFVPGARIEMLRPGAPCIVRLDETRLALSDRLQASILLAPGSVPGQPRRHPHRTTDPSGAFCPAVDPTP